MADTLPGMSYIDMLKTQYDVVGGYNDNERVASGRGKK